MSLNVLVLYEMADRASRVTTRKALREFEKWVLNTITLYKDATIERMARSHLFRLKSQLAF